MHSSMSQVATVFIFATVLGLSAASRAGFTSYEDFRLVHRMDKDADSITYAEREAIFEARKAEVTAHNAKQESWKMTLNHFADYTKDELESMNGYKGRSARSGQSSFLQMGGDGVHIGEIDTSQLSETVDWTGKMNFSNFVHDQGACGSCWAHAAVAALEAHAELATGAQSFLATQEIIDCSANPLHCGGTGGCKGATAEIALEQARKHGIGTKDKYTADSCGQDRPSAITVDSFVRLPENKASYLLQALATKGPVVMSVAANNLHLYDKGIFSGCEPDTVVNHAVLGVGYGKNYWQIKNSWGDKWGEKGYFRVERRDDDRWMCGTDNKPQEGVYCDKAPASIEVCGMCGITSDSAYPVILPPAGQTAVVKPFNLRQTGNHVNFVNVF